MSPLQESMLVGDRVPNFVRPTHEGAPFDLYKDRCGQEVIVLLLAQPALARIALMDGPDARHVVALAVGTPESVSKSFEGTLPANCVLLADGGDLTAFLRSGNEAAAVALVLDRNCRVVHKADCNDERRLLAWWQQVAQAKPSFRRPGSAPVLIIPGVFEPDFCQTVIQHFESEGSEPSGVLIQKADGKLVYQPDDEVKIRREQRLQSGPLLTQIVQRIERRVLPEIQWAFNYRVTRYEGVKTVMYHADRGGFFAPHRDNDGVDTAHRRFAMTLNLNSEDYQGGALRFPEYESAGYKPPSGTAVIFSCNLAHEALPIESGRRFALISFFNSDAEVQQHVNMERNLGE